jgi:hypothetical protein
MPRPLRLSPIPFGWYYYQRTATHGREIIRDRADLELFRRLLGATLRQAGADLHFVHVDRDVAHLAVRSGEPSLVKALGSFFRVFAQRMNCSRSESGALFKPHAHVLLFKHDKWLLPLGRYIHWIPRLRKTDFYWNSEVAYQHRLRTAGLNTSVAFRVASRGSRDERAQDEAYRAFFERSPNAAEVRLIEYGSPEDSRILGDSGFVIETLKRIGMPLPSRPMRSPDPERDIRRITEYAIQRFHALCMTHLSRERACLWVRLATLENACSRSRKQPLPMLRGLIAEHVLSNRVATLEETERFFGCRSGSLSAGIRRRQILRAQMLFNGHHHAAPQPERHEDPLAVAKGDAQVSDDLGGLVRAPEASVDRPANA